MIAFSIWIHHYQCYQFRYKLVISSFFSSVESFFISFPPTYSTKNISFKGFIELIRNTFNILFTDEVFLEHDSTNLVLEIYIICSFDGISFNFFGLSIMTDLYWKSCSGNLFSCFWLIFDELFFSSKIFITFSFKELCRLAFSFWFFC